MDKDRRGERTERDRRERQRERGETDKERETWRGETLPEIGDELHTRRELDLKKIKINQNPKLKLEKLKFPKIKP